MRIGAPWRDLPDDYGDWKNTHLNKLIDEPDCEWLLIDESHVKVHPHAAGAGGNQTMSHRGLNTKIHLAVDAHGMPLKNIITEGTTAIVPKQKR